MQGYAAYVSIITFSSHVSRETSLYPFPTEEPLPQEGAGSLASRG